jgi:dienelactone hydrolase
VGSTRSAEVVVLHHLLGLTTGVLALGAHLRALGAEVRTPDLFDGVVHDDLAAGAAHLEAVGMATLLARADVALGDLGAGAVLVGLSLGAVPGERAAQLRGDVAGVVLVGACLPPDAFAPGWPAATAIRIHAAVDDPLFRDEGDAEAAAALVAAASDATLRLHGGSGHLLVEDGHPDHDADASAAVVADVVALLDASSWSGPA